MSSKKSVQEIFEEHQRATLEALDKLNEIRKERISKSRNGLIYHPPLEEKVINLPSFKDYNPKVSLAIYQESYIKKVVEKLSDIGKRILNYFKW